MFGKKYKAHDPMVRLVAIDGYAAFEDQYKTESSALAEKTRAIQLPNFEFAASLLNSIDKGRSPELLVMDLVQSTAGISDDQEMVMTMARRFFVLMAAYEYLGLQVEAGRAMAKYQEFL